MKHVEIYTDGVCVPNPGHGGWGAVLIYGDARKEISGDVPGSTNNLMEIEAAAQALSALSQPCKVTLYSDSQYLIKCITGEWKRSSNLRAWRRLDAAAERHWVAWRWLKGHNGNLHNGRAYILAIGAVRKAKGIK